MNEPVHRHHWIVRLTHWSAFALIFGMIASGLQIYRAYPRFGERGGPYYPNIFQDLAFPEWTRLGGWLGRRPQLALLLHVATDRELVLFTLAT